MEIDIIRTLQDGGITFIALFMLGLLWRQYLTMQQQYISDLREIAQLRADKPLRPPSLPEVPSGK